MSDQHTAELVAHLRNADIGICDEAADEIERLQAQVATDKEETPPEAWACDTIHDGSPHNPSSPWCISGRWVSVTDTEET